ncbi:probable serine/threonine-protein kinase DDB_G0278509 [Oryza brachyantha]|uniref:Uncharacterized protein n=1 Tax=Oryza brachyantha TaxID=4533 RepID=J3MI16_ORYBR|nr:probable serine/threonine-protein kinase DDB_G0278509 [Oryza brachyantha]
MVRFFCFSSSTSTTHHRTKERFLPAEQAMLSASQKNTILAVSQMDSQDQTVKSNSGSASPSQMTDRNGHSDVNRQYDTSPSSHQECWSSEDLNRYACSDDGKEVGHLKKSQSLGNMLHKDHDHLSEGAKCDIIDCDHKCHCSSLKSNSAVQDSANLNTKGKENASSDLISHDVCEPSVGNAADSDSHYTGYTQTKFPRSQSAIFQNNSNCGTEGSADSEILGPRCRSYEDLCLVGCEKAEYMNSDEPHHSKSNLDIHFGGPSPDVYETMNFEGNGSIGCSDAAEGGQRSSASAEESFVRDGVLIHEYWDKKYVSGDQSVDPATPYYSGTGDGCHHSNNDCSINESLDQERKDNLCNRDSTPYHESLVIDVSDLKLCDSRDISKEVEHNETETNVNQYLVVDPDQLTPRTFSIKRIEDWINQIDIDDGILVEEQGENSNSVLTKYSEPVTGVPAIRPDAKSPLGMEIAYTYISKLTSTSSSAQLANLGLVAIPRLSTFSGLRLLNLSGNSIVRITAGALPRGLHMLSLSKNNISTIEGLRELTRLRLLDISYNRISRIGHGLASCSSLKELYLCGNKISEVDGLHRLLKLKVLDLRHNKISTSKGLGQLAANYNSLEAVNLDGNPAQKNVGDEHLKKYLLGLLPNLAVYNKNPVRASGSKEVSDRHTRKISSSHRTGRLDRKSSRLVAGTGTSSYKAQSSRHARSSGSFLKHHPRARSMAAAASGSRLMEHAG